METVEAQVLKAVKALASIQPKQDSDLLEKPSLLLVQFTLRKMQDKQRIKPIPIKISTPLNSSPKICLIVKDPQRKYKDLVALNKLPIDKVIGIQKLKTKHKSFQQKRLLCDEFDLFIADDNVIELLPRLLGKQFFNKKNSVKAATLDMTVDEQVQNIMDVINGCQKKLYGQLDNIMAIHVKTSDSVALPVFQQIIQ